MSLNKIFTSMKKEGYVVKPLELYLLSLDSTDKDRAIDVNAPSAIGGCLRSRYYARIGAERDGVIDARTRRIFDNGTRVHERLQDYLKECGVLLMDEVPVINREHNIQGHTDGILKLSDTELGVLEIKSINSRGFSELKAEKPEHTKQGLIYLYCLESRRKELKEKYPTEQSFKSSVLARRNYYSKFYQHLKDGSKYTAKEKVSMQVSLCMKMDKLLYYCNTPITKVIFLYESKDTQDLKEYCVTSTSPHSQVILSTIIEECDYLNRCITAEEVPERCATNKNDNACRWCAFKTECWC